MRAPLACVLLAGCSTVESSRVVSTTRGAEKCDGELVASVFPGDWPDVVLEVVEQRSCDTPITETLEVSRELRVWSQLPQGIGAGIGFAAGLAAELLLVNQSSSRSVSFNQADGWMLLPFAGAATGAALVAGLNVTRQAQPLAGEVRLETSYAHRDFDSHGTHGLIALGHTPLAMVHGGRAQLPLELAMSSYGRPMLLDGRRVEWSVRSTAWVPGRLPPCVRAAAFNESVSFALAPAADLASAEADAEVCAKDGWPFATRMLVQLSRACRERFQKSCWAAR